MTSSSRTAVCCLSSLNLEKYDEWKDTPLVENLVRFLDNVLEYFIRLAPPELHRAVHSAKEERAVGIGTLGFHSLLQLKGIPFESGGLGSASQLTEQVYSLIKSKAAESSKQLAKERGEAPDTLGSGMRNSHLLAIAPNASTSSLINVSPSIEPWSSNAINAQGRAGSFLIKNQRLQEALKELGKDTEEVWDKVIANKGSVEGLSFLSAKQKKIFKTFSEIDPKWIIELASIRQKHICQSQSVNLKVKATITLEEMSDIHILAWVRGLKTLYYCRGEKPTNSSIQNNVQEVAQPLNKVEIDFEECLSCSG